MRYRANGSLDPSFGKGGIDVTSITGSPAAVTVQTDGKILAMGNFTRPIVVRFNSNGTLDRTFGTNGIAAINFSGELTAIVLQPNGRIVMGADGGSSTRPRVGLVRLLSNGRLDSTFGSGGFALLDVFGTVKALAAAQDATFEALVSSPAQEVQAIHFSASGQFIELPPNDSLEVIESTSNFTFQLDAKTVFGQAFRRGNQNARFTRFNTTDPTFLTPSYKFGNSNSVNAITSERNGGILTAGEGDQAFALGRFNQNGSLDFGFGSGGIVKTTFLTGPGTGASVQALLVQPDRKIVAVGNWFNNAAGTMGIALARYLGP